MNKLILVLATLVATNAFALTPFTPEVDARFKRIEASSAGGALSDSYIIVGNGSGVATAVPVTGAVSMTNAGVFSISATPGGVPTAGLADYTADGLHPIRIARGTYNVTTMSGSIGAHALNVSLPAKSIITKAWYFIATQFSNTSGTTNMSFECEDAANLMALRATTGFASGTIQGADVSGPSANMVGNIGAACGLVATVSKTNAAGADAALNAGRLILFVEYVVGI